MEGVLRSLDDAVKDVETALIHPHYVLRVAGEPASRLRETWTGESDEAWTRIDSMRERSAAESEELSDLLAQVVPAITDVADRRLVLGLRRALHNGRPAKAAQLEAARRHADGTLYGRIAGLDRVHVDLAAALAAFESVHQREIACGAESLRSLMDAHNLQLALSYNNPQLLRRLRKHYIGDAPLTDNKAVRNHEDSLLQYYARASTKTSPLSSFTMMHVGSWRDQAEGAQASRLSNRVVRKVEGKAALLRHILDSWLKDYELVRRAFPLALNPTIRESDGKLELQVVTAGRDFIGRTWGTGIDAARIDAGPMLACVASALDDRDVALPAEVLVERICALAPKLPRDAVDGYVKKLFELGYLVAKTDFVEQTDALEWMAGVVESAGDAASADVRSAVARLRTDLEVMRGEDVEQRICASLDVDAAFADLAEATGARRGGYLFRTPFYENCYFSEGGADLSVASIEAYRGEFDLLQQLNRILDSNQQVQANMCDYFVSRFGEDGTCNDVGGFIKDFDATYAPLVSEGKADAEGIAERSPRTLALVRAEQAFEDYLKPLLQQGRDVQFDPEALRGIIALLPQQMRTKSTSYSYLVQPARSGEFDGLVLNQVFGGRSGIISRFCEILDGEGEERLRTYLREGAEGSRNVELGGVFGFNANRHPAMSDTELVVPPFGHSFAGTRKILLSELKLRYDPRQHRLRFLDHDDLPVDVWYHGLLSPVLLPAVHRAIALGFTEGPSFMFTNVLLSLMETSDSEVIHSPRVSLGRVVVSRRSWLVASSAYPDASVSAADFYLAVREWQRRHGLPDRVFVRAVLDAGADKSRIKRYEAMKDINFKDLKPFFVDMRNPRFVRLLQNMMRRHELPLFMTELLPDFNEHASTVDGEVHVSELHFELTRQAVPPKPADLRWYALRVAYFADRKPLVLGPIAEAIDVAKRKFGIEKAFFLTHWKFGPHIDIVLQCDSEVYATQVLPELQAIIEAWIARNPSRAQIDPVEYEKTSRWVGTFEIDSGPYLPLLADNSVTPVPYVRPRTILIPEVAESKELMLSDCSDLLLALYRLKETDTDGFFLALHAMLAATAQTFVAGIEAGYMSLRSHADYFFAAHDTDDALRRKFDEIDAKRSADLDRVIVAAAEGRFADAGLPEQFVPIVEQWSRILADVDGRSKRIVESRYEDLIAQNDRFSDMATSMRQDVPDEFFERVSRRRISEIGDAFINTEAGKQALRRPEFLVFRINVNLFYSLLPLLDVPPIQKFLLCHLVSNSVERAYGQSWREKVARVRAR